ncbi:MAG: hypothetical protein ABSC41_17590, partial [Acidimicrobiales bacterium]
QGANEWPSYGGDRRRQADLLPLLDAPMVLFIIMVPLMIVALLIATVPILYVSVRENRLIQFGSADKPRSQKDSEYHVRKIAPALRQSRKVEWENIDV